MPRTFAYHTTLGHRVPCLLFPRAGLCNPFDPTWGFARLPKSNGRKVVRGRETWPGLPPFAFGRTQDRENGENLCRPHPETRAKIRPSHGAGSRASNSTLGIAPEAFLSVQVQHVGHSRRPSIACSLETEPTAAEPIEENRENHKCRLHGVP
jgi:hypothetical protein